MKDWFKLFLIQELFGKENITVIQSSGGKSNSSSNSIPYSQVPDGTIDGVNDTFTLSNTPIANSLRVYLNGLRLTQEVDFTLSGKIITMTTIPFPGDTLICDYVV